MAKPDSIIGVPMHEYCAERIYSAFRFNEVQSLSCGMGISARPSKGRAGSPTPVTYGGKPAGECWLPHKICTLPIREPLYYFFMNEQGASILNLLITNYELRITNYSLL